MIAEASARRMARVSIRCAKVVMKPTAKPAIHMVVLGHCQTNSAGISVKIVRKKEKEATTALVPLACASKRINMMLQEGQAGIAGDSVEPTRTAPDPGRHRMSTALKAPR